jgi:hypothetical protein
VKSGAPKDKTLDARSDVQAFHSMQVASGGFLTLGSFRSLAGLGLGRAGGPDAMLGNEIERIFAGLPNKGTTPIVFQGNVTQSPLRSRFTFNLPKASLDDISALIAQMH